MAVPRRLVLTIDFRFRRGNKAAHQARALAPDRIKTYIRRLAGPAGLVIDDLRFDRKDEERGGPHVKTPRELELEALLWEVLKAPVRFPGIKTEPFNRKDPNAPRKVYRYTAVEIRDTLKAKIREALSVND